MTTDRLAYLIAKSLFIASHILIALGILGFILFLMILGSVGGRTL